jgi:ribonuclease HII
MTSRYIVGIDEVGRGPLAGPITVAAVAISRGGGGVAREKFLKNLKDSKKLSAKKREHFLKEFSAYQTTNSDFFMAVASVGPRMIDAMGISAAARLCVKRCLGKIMMSLSTDPLHFTLLLDGGLRAPKEYIYQKSIIKGDEKVPVIAAASIVAKVTRDAYMTEIHKKFPDYNFAQHKGYGTRAHEAAIKKHGLCALHRKTFCRKFM